MPLPYQAWQVIACPYIQLRGPGPVLSQGALTSSMNCLQPILNVGFLTDEFYSKSLPAVENVESYSHKDPG